MSQFKVNIRVNDRSVEIQEEIETNYKAGEAIQLADLFHRTLLACGYEVDVAYAAFARVAANGGYGRDEGQLASGGMGDEE